MQKVDLRNGDNLFRIYDEFPWKEKADFTYNDYNGVFTKIRLKAYYSFHLKHFDIFASNLTDAEILHIQNVYNLDEALIKLNIGGRETINSRKKTRFHLNLKLKNLKTNDKYRIVDLSRTGMRLLLEAAGNFQETMLVNLEVDSNWIIKIELKKVWQEGSIAGYSINTVDLKQWDQFILSLEERLPVKEDFRKAA